PRAHEAHVPEKDVPELRDLVEACATEELPDARDARIRRRGPDGTGVALRVHDHAAELVDLEGASEGVRLAPLLRWLRSIRAAAAAIDPDANLRIENRPRTIEENRGGDHQANRKKNDEPDR